MTRETRDALKKLPFGFWLLAAVLWLWGGTKPPGQRLTVAWDEYFAQTSASVSTNDPRLAAFGWTPAVDWLPAGAEAVISATRYGSNTLFTAASAPMSQGFLSVRMPEDATNYAYFVECDWTPAPAVVTNGVYHIGAFKAPEARYIPAGTAVRLQSGLSAASYVQDGLVAMWDGIENAGRGVHDPDAATWADLCGGTPLTLSNHDKVAWGADCLVGLDRSRAADGAAKMPLCASASPLPTSYGTMELVIRRGCANFVLFMRGGSYAYPHAVCNAQNRGLEFSYENGAGVGGIIWARLPAVGTRFHAAHACETWGTTAGVYLNGARETVDHPRQSCTYKNSLGCGYNSSDSNALPFVGEICAMRFYSRALTADEIAQNYEVDRIRFNLP